MNKSEPEYVYILLETGDHLPASLCPILIYGVFKTEDEDYKKKQKLRLNMVYHQKQLGIF